MPYNAGYTDRILTCRECGQTFTFTAGEQEFYASRNLTNDPSRCPDCRAARRSGQGGGGGGGFRQPRAESSERYETTCADCGRVTSVPFIPREDRPVYCSDCYQNHKPARTAGRRDDSRSYSSGSSGGYGGGSGGGYGGGRGGRSSDRGGRRDRDYDRY